MSSGWSTDTPIAHPFPDRDRLATMVRNAASRAMSIRACIPSFVKTWQMWVATAQRDSSSPGEPVQN